MTRLLYVVNIPRFFVSHRLPLALAARDAGYEVHVATSRHDSAHIAHITAADLPFHPLPLSQHGTRPHTEADTVRTLAALYRRLRPQIVHHVTIKPVLYGGIAARMTQVPAVVAAMSGLGYVFTGEGAKPRLLRTLVQPGVRLALSHPNTHMIFQNPDDRDRFTALRLIDAERTSVIRGSGVDVTRFSPQPEPEEPPVVLFAGRLMWKKGLGHFVEAARRLRDSARFVVAGYAEATSPDHVPPEQLQAWADEGVITWLGRQDDMPRVFAQSHIVCLPSTYGEGVPKVLIEAAACGRACVTTDTPGCREIVRDGVNGLLVPAGDEAALVDALTEALHQLITEPGTRQRMGEAGRELAVSAFALAVVTRETFAVYERLLGR